MRTQLPVKICWLTDIHFAAHYRGVLFKGDVKKYVKSLLAELDQAHQVKSPIDYLLITGDLVQSGTKSDYNQFWKQILKPILDFFLDRPAVKQPLVLTIPGNHDVNWKRGRFLGRFIKILNGEKRTWPKRNTYLLKNQSKFQKLFKDYTTFIKECIQMDGGRYQAMFNFESDVSIQVSGYKDKYLYGHIIDFRRQMIMVLLNSAWYSLGDSFDTMLAKRIIKEKEFKKNEDFIFKKLKEKEYVTEYNTQVSGIQLLDNPALKKLITDYPDFTLVTCIHHPMNWMAWDEYYNYTSGEEHAGQLFRKLLEKSDILLTGHEHVPDHVPPDSLGSNTVHLKGGCFLTFAKPGSALNFQYNWFSILEIDPAESRLSQTILSVDSVKRQPALYPGELKPVHLPRRNDKFNLTDDRQNSILSSAMTAKDEPIRLVAYLQGQQLINVNAKILISLASPPGWEDAFSVYKADSGGEIYLLTKKKFCYISLDNLFYDWLEKIILNEPPGIVVRFLVPDLHISIEETVVPEPDPYRIADIAREDFLKILIKGADMQFDRFRHRFFNRYEKKPNRELFKTLKTASFANHIIPYWVFEKIWI